MFKIFFYINELNNIHKENLNQLRNVNIIYRNYRKNDYFKNALIIANFCKKKKFKLYVANDIKLARKINSHGLYIPSFNQLTQYKSIFEVIGSAHNEIQVRNKIQQGCKEIFISPIFNTKSGYNKVGKGLNFYRTHVFKYPKKVKVYALGGIDHNNFKKIILSGGCGFASINMIEKEMNSNLISQLNLIATNS